MANAAIPTIPNSQFTIPRGQAPFYQRGLEFRMVNGELRCLTHRAAPLTIHNSLVLAQLAGKDYPESEQSQESYAAEYCFDAHVLSPYRGRPSAGSGVALSPSRRLAAGAVGGLWAADYVRLPVCSIFHIIPEPCFDGVTQMLTLCYISQSLYGARAPISMGRDEPVSVL